MFEKTKNKRKKQPGSLPNKVTKQISCMCEFFFDILTYPWIKSSLT